MKHVATILLFLFHTDALALPLSSKSTRRRFLDGSALVGATWSLTQEDARAVKGAAEYDLEYYVRDLVGGNKREGNVQPSAGPPVAPPRTLLGPLVLLLLNDDCDRACIPTQALMQQLKQTTDSESIVITDRVQDYRSKARRSFQTRAPWKDEHVTDQYYFDLTSYAFWRTAADLVPDYVARSIFAANVGRLLYREAKSKALLTTRLPKGCLLSNTVPAMTEILQLFTTSQYCKSFRFGDKDSDGIVFDDLDDDDLVTGASVNFLLSVFEPATLGASLQITGEQSRFLPDYVGTTLAAMWESVGIQAAYETYFVDPEYRPNPKDYFPNEQLLQFTLTKL